MYVFSISRRYENFNIKKIVSNFKKLNVIRVMTTKKSPGRPKVNKPATDQGSTAANTEKEQIKDGGTRNEKAPEAKEAKSEEKVIESENISSEILGDEKTELERLKEENARIKEELAKKEEKTTEKVVEVTTGKPKALKEEKVRPSRTRYQTHTVYVTKKKGDDEWGNEQTREMSEQSYNAIAKDLSLKVRLPRDSRLVEPQPKGCKDC